MTNRNKVLFLWLDENDFFPRQAKKRDVLVGQVFKDNKKIMKFLRRFHLKMNLPFIRMWLGAWLKDISQVETIIIHASKLTPPVVKYLTHKFPSIRVIVWYWNPVDKSVEIDQFGDKCEIWVFDEKDSSQYGLQYNTQYYFDNINLPSNKEKNDILFVGNDKGRIEILINLKNKLESLNLLTDFHIVRNGRLNLRYKEMYKEKISYEEILEKISQSKVILDIVSGKQSGLTLRPLESIFFKKKLITNDKTMINRDFYNKKNIFILGKDDINTLERFVKEPYENLSEEIVKQYDFDFWLNRFFIENRNEGQDDIYTNS